MSSSTTTTKTTTKTVTITKKTNFYDDKYFQDSWNDYDEAMKNTIQKFEKDDTPKIDYTNRNQCTDVYRKIRNENIEKDMYKSQALQVAEKDDRYQYVMDVKDFNPNELQVKVIGNKITIDGKFERTTPEGAYSTKSFHKEFTLLSNADMENVTTAVSKDGVLTIKIPKKGGTPGAITSTTKKTDDSTQKTQQTQQTQQTKKTQQTQQTQQTVAKQPGQGSPAPQQPPQQQQQQQTSTTTTKTTKTVTITKREPFYDDEYFQDNWDDFDSAVKQTIQKFETDSTPKVDYNNRKECTDTYRKIRTENIEKDMYKSQAVQVTEKDDRYQYVMDVKDFSPNDLQVKVIGNKITVDGKFEKTTPDGKWSTKSFHKEFTLLSNADMEKVSTAVSKDGVLTIRIPKKDAVPSGAITPTPSDAQPLPTTIDDSTTQQTQQIQQTKNIQQTQQTQQVQETQQTQEILQTQQIKQTQQIQETETQEESQPTPVASPAPQQPQQPTPVVTPAPQQPQQPQPDASPAPQQPPPQQQKEHSSTTTTTTKKTVTITKREPFYDDDYFEDTWDDYDNAVKNTIQNFETDSTPKVDYTNRNECTDVYRKIRTENIDKDVYKSQALQVTEKDDRYQYVMDVKDFSPDDLQIKVIGNKITIDGKFEKTTPDGKWSSKSFHKEFTLLSNADMENVTTALSKDGVLTIRIPKKPQSTPQPLPQQTQPQQKPQEPQPQPIQPQQPEPQQVQPQQLQPQQTQPQQTQPQQPQAPQPQAPQPLAQQPQAPQPQQPQPGQQQQQQQSTTTTKTTKTVTITKREPFYDDQYFEDTWDDFDSAVKQTIQKFETDSTPKIDYNNRNTCTDVYRKIRTDNIEKDIYKSQALQATEKDDKFQYVMDVKDFSPNDLQVKVIENKVTVDGKFEKTTPDGAFSSKSFHKEFTLPSTAKLDQITTALSKDGVLTIKIPKSAEGTPISSPSSAVTPSTQQTSTVQQNISSTQDASSKKTSVQQSTVQQTSSVRDSSTQQTAVQQAVRDTSTVTSAPHQQASNVAKITKTTKTVTINKRDPFYDDSFFADNWGDFDNAMKKTIQKFETEMTPKIDFGNRNACTDVYRKIRTNNIEKDLYASQALDVAIKDGKFQCVMDVKDFNPNDLQVKVVEFKVVVDGKFEKTTESGSFTSKSFHKEFTLPNVADMENVSTALSKDGVLTIKAPIKLHELPRVPVATKSSKCQ